MENPFRRALEQVNSIFTRINTVEDSASDYPTAPDQDHDEQKLLDDAVKDNKLIAETAALWLSTYNQYYSLIKLKQDRAYAYWRGTQPRTNLGNMDISRAATANIIFEAAETFLPVATHRNPEAYVRLGDESPPAKEYKKMIQELLEIQAKEKGLKYEIRNATRHWMTDYIGVLGVSWNTKDDDFELVDIDPRRMIFDIEGKINAKGLFRGRYLGYKRTMQASEIKAILPSSTAYINKKTQNKDGTNVDIIEWWTNDLVFYTCEDGKEVLGKFKFPHWNYDKTGIDFTEAGAPYETLEKGYNFFKTIEYPFIFITNLNTGKQPHDETSLIEQSIPSQDVLSKRMAQSDFNADIMNNSFTVSGEYFTQDQAAQFARAMASGDVGYVPQKQTKDGNYDLQNAYRKDAAIPLPQDIYMQINQAKADIRSIFGTYGLTAESQAGEETVRGKAIIQQSDTGRVTGGIIEVLEVVAATAYQWMLQMMYVYYDVEDYAELIGPEKTQLYLMLQKQYITLCPRIYVKEGSLQGTDPVAMFNRYANLFQMGVMDPLTLIERSDIPDPETVFQRLMQFQSPPGAAPEGTPEQMLSGAMPQNGGGEGGGGYQSTIPPISPMPAG
jgi:hypothetical protein